jgi:hypothetical protein
MGSSTKNAPKSNRDIAYYKQRYQNRVYTKLVNWISQESERQQITKKDLAERLGKDAGQLSRLLGHPSNLTLDTITELLLAFDAEAEPPEIVRFADRPVANYMHPLIAKIAKPTSEPNKLKVDSAASPRTINSSNKNQFAFSVG